MLLALTLTGCGTTALVYSSTQVAGLQIQTVDEATKAPSIDFGWNLQDFAYVPVRTKETGEDIQGSYIAASGDFSDFKVKLQSPDKPLRCSTSSNGNCAPQPEVELTEPKPTAISSESLRQRGRMFEISTMDGDFIKENDFNFASDDTALSEYQLTNLQDYMHMAFFVAPALDITGDQAQEMRDAYSTFGTFRGNSGARGGGDNGSSGSITLSKTFSTGIASQQLTEGYNFYLQKIADSKKTCFKVLELALTKLEGTLTLEELKETIGSCEAQ